MEKAAAALPASRTAPLRSVAFRRFLWANLVSATGSAMAPLALAYSVIGEGGGAGDLGLVLATNTVPTVVFLLVGGVLADRLSRSRMLFLGNLLAAAAQGALAVIVATGHASTSSIAVCGFVSGTAMAFTVPAAQGAVGQIVPVEQLQQANALLRLPGNAVKVLGPAVGGVVVAVSGPAWALAWDALTFAVAAVLLLGLRLDAPVTVTGALSDLRQGWTGFWSRTWLWTYTASGTVVVAAWLAGFQLLGPVVAAQRYAGARDWGLVQGAFAAGLLAGTVVCLRWRPYRLLAVAVAGGMPLAAPLFVMGWGLPLPWVLLAALLAGVGLDVAIVAWSTAFQQHVPQGELGRLSAFNSVGERLAIPLGYLLTALAVGTWDNRTVLVACAGLVVAAAVLNLCVRDVYRINRRSAGG
ncbi:MULTISPECIES: MFS transporter [unclassified Streptomyces]|uniref:MFS transporter n=1 Tax=unclassified Streptomyces TaxID=2593676 RepID=UPI002366B3CB|nr:MULTISPECIES: MFS transporter [unclassified Streptomyces]MDF3147671.1 MFS transporter [Streptomyces sp. T21Q-yed]WDF38772.1 MFS transporter [Streptomyces sp. T12]